MNSLNQSLADIVSAYANYDFLTKSYHYVPISTEEKQKIEVQLITIFSQILTERGVEEKQINYQRQGLRILFHPDKLAQASPEIQWLDMVLSNGNEVEKGACFKLIDNCSEELKYPKLNKVNFTFDQNDFDCLSITELIALLENSRQSAKTLTQRALIESTLSLLQNIRKLQSTTDKIEPDWFKNALRSLPYITSGFCIGLYIKELSLLYAVLYVIGQGSDWLKKYDSQCLNYIGGKAREFSKRISDVATTLMFYFISINFAAVNTTYYIGIETCSKIYQIISNVVAPQRNEYNSYSSTAQSRALMLTPQHFLPGKLLFESLELKLIALKLEQYQEQQKKQYFAVWRKGCIKSCLIEKTLQKFKLIDLKSISVEQKLIEAKAIINTLAKHPYFKENKSRAKETIEAVKMILKALATENTNKENASQQLIVKDNYAFI